MIRKAHFSVSVLVVICISLVLSGCAIPLSKIRVKYDSRGFAKPSIEDASKVRLYVVEFSDVTGNVEEKVVGEANTGIAGKKTPIVIEETIDSLSTRALRKAFAKTGFDVVEDESTADLLVKGRINSFWVQEYQRGASQHTEATVEFDVAVFDRVSDDPMWFDVKRSHIRSEPNTIDVSYQNERVLRRAFSEVIASILNDGEFALAIEDFVATNK